MSINAIVDALKAFALSLQVPTVFPAGLFVLVNMYFVSAKLVPDYDLASPAGITTVISLTLMLSYLLYAFNFPLIRLFEGYILKETRWLKWRRRRQLQKFTDLERKIDRAQWRRVTDRLPDELRADLACWECSFDEDYPPVDTMVLPTKLGNTIAAFESYSGKRYGMNSIALWPRFVPVLKGNGFLDFVTQEKSVFDFLMNTYVVALVLGLEFFYWTLFLGDILQAIAIAAITSVVVILLYEGMIVAARQWGTAVRVAFDLYRQDLYQSLGLRPASSFEEEHNRWHEISRFFLYRRDYRGFRGFAPQDRVNKQEHANSS